MYIELFLLDNLLMNLLVLHLTAVLLSVRPNWRRSMVFAMGGAVYAAVGAGLFPMLLSFPFKLIAGLPLAFALPVRNIRQFLKNWLALLLATLMAGGAVFAISLIFSDDYSSGIALRTFLIGALAVLILPHWIRRILARRVRNENIVQIEIQLSVGMLHCPALVDTGCSLIEPISALPVILLPESFEKEALQGGIKRSFPIPMATAAGESMLQGFRSKGICIDGRSIQAVIAFAKVRVAIVPGMLMPAAE